MIIYRTCGGSTTSNYAIALSHALEDAEQLGEQVILCHRPEGGEPYEYWEVYPPSWDMPPLLIGTKSIVGKQ